MNRCLNPCSCGGWSQREHYSAPNWCTWISLNPCSCGGWSQSGKQRKLFLRRNVLVLILVLVEDGLRGRYLGAYVGIQNRLNPCSCGGWSQRRCIESSYRISRDCLNPCSCGGWSQSYVVVGIMLDGRKES